MRKDLSGSELAVAAGLAIASFLLYVPSLSNLFLGYDDHHYVTANRVVQQGITWDGFFWAFRTTTFANWLPVTWLSHMLDCEWYGLNPAGHHATSAVLHAFNAALLFLALRTMTARFWAPAVAAAVFAVHPVRVESVAWVAERKDVLCGTFMMLALLAYAAYARRPSAGRYLVVAICHALGLMSKTMLVTLPCVLLLLDFWPLGRMRFGKGRIADDTGRDASPSDAATSGIPARPLSWLILEKLPLLALSIVASGWTFVFQSTGGAMWAYRDLTLYQRVANAFVSVPRYLGLFFWPADLSVFYPHPGSWHWARVAGSVAIVLILSAGAAAAWRRRPYVTVGWFWFLGMLVPVSGVIQVGLQAMADRYLYLPGVGLTIVAVWSMSEAIQRRPLFRVPAVVGTAVVLLVLSAATWRQQRHWQNTLTLFQHSLDVDPDNWFAHNLVGSLFATNGEAAFDRGDMRLSRSYYQTAADHLRRSLEKNPGHYATMHNYGWTLFRLDRPVEATEYFRRSIKAYPEWGYSHLYLGLALARMGQFDEAIALFEQAAKLLPNEAKTHLHWAEALISQGRREEAVRELNETIRLDPNNTDMKFLLEQVRAAIASPSTAPATAPSTAPSTAPINPPAK